MKKYRRTGLPGDGIGPEVTEAAVRVIDRAGGLFGFEAEYDYRLLGGIAIDETGVPMPDETVASCKAADAVLLGAVGGPKWDGLGGDKRPEAGLLGIRKALGLFANLRPAKIFPALKDASPLRADKVSDGLDLLVVRELTGGIYFGKRGRTESDGLPAAFDTEMYNTAEIDRILETGFRMAMGRGKKLCSVDKANVLESSRLWRERALLMAEKYPEVELSHLYVDNCAMQLVIGCLIMILIQKLFARVIRRHSSSFVIIHISPTLNCMLSAFPEWHTSRIIQVLICGMSFTWMMGITIY